MIEREKEDGPYKDPKGRNDIAFNIPVEVLGMMSVSTLQEYLSVSLYDVSYSLHILLHANSSVL